MTAIPVSSAVTLASYSDLTTFVTNLLQLDSDTAGQLPNLLRLAEAELDRIILPPNREVSATLTASSGSVALPSDFAEMISLQLNDYWPLSPVTLNVLNSRYPLAVGNGLPEVYAISVGNIVLGPSPDATYTLTAKYQASLAGLSDTNTVNWLLTSYPDAYVYALMFQAEAYRNNDERLPGVSAKLAQVVDQINKKGNRARASTPMRLRSPGTVV